MFFSLFSPLNIYISLFSLSVCSLPAPSLLPCLLFVPLLHRSPRRKAIRAPLLPSLRLSSACPPLLLPSVCALSVFCLVSSLLLSLCPHPAASVCRSVCRAACLLLVHHQAQNAMTVGTDAPRVCPRPYLLLPMCCRVSRRLFRCPFRGLPCVLLPCVVWRQ